MIKFCFWTLKTIIVKCGEIWFLWRNMVLCSTCYYNVIISCIFIQVIWSTLYSTASAGDQGTLYAARNTLNSRNVTKDPSDDFYAASDLIEKVTIAYIVAGGLKYFQMQSLHSEPEQNDYTGDVGNRSLMSEYLLNHATTFVKSYALPVIPSLPDYGPQNNSVKCRYCTKQYRKPKALRRHEATIHGHQDPLYNPDHSDNRDSSSQHSQEEDRVRNYSQLILTLGLLRLDHNDAIHMGDGERIMVINQFLMMYYKACHCPKYAYGILETIAQTKVLLTERMAHRLIWNRTVNHRGEFSSNHPNDLDIEHCNKIFKEEARSYRGVFTQKTVNRVSRSALSMHNIVKNYSRQCNVVSPSGRHTAVDMENDIQTLVEQYHNLNLFHVIPGRVHHGHPNIDNNLLHSLDMDAVRNWISKSLKEFSRKHFYSN